MFDALKSFFDDLTRPNPARGFTPDDASIAAAALLIHIANADGVIDARERRRLRRLVETQFDLKPDEARKLIALAQESENEAVDLYQFTAILKRRLDEAKRREIVALLWEMVYADGRAHEFEVNIVWRVAELLGVASRERIALRRQAEQAGEEVLPANPWGNTEDGL